MDTFRYGLAVLIVVFFPPAILYWYVVHPFVGFWRRLGPKVTYVVICPPLLVLAYLLYGFRETLIGADLGTNPWTIAAGIVGYVVAGVIERSCRRHLSFRTLAGVPELSSDPDDSELLDEGIYGRIRHPRYTGLMVALAAIALICNHLGLYLFVAATFPAFYGLVLLEEHELRQRFGREYVEYSRRVPRFVPRL